MALFNMSRPPGATAAGPAPDRASTPAARRIGVALSDVSLHARLAVWRDPPRQAGRQRRRDRRASPGARTRPAWSSAGRSRWTARIGPAAQAARDWALALSEATALPAALWDERLSSAAVNRFLIEEADLTRRKRAARVDGMAAAYTLQAALDATRPNPPRRSRKRRLA